MTWRLSADPNSPRAPQAAAEPGAPRRRRESFAPNVVLHPDDGRRESIAASEPLLRAALSAYIARSARLRSSTLSEGLSIAVPTLRSTRTVSPPISIGWRIPAASRAEHGEVLVRGLARHHDELVAPDAGDQIVLTAQLTQALGDAHQHPVSCFVPEPVVDLLEPVEVAEDDSHGCFVAS